jgi:hypothetical protein
MCRDQECWSPEAENLFCYLGGNCNEFCPFIRACLTTYLRGFFGGRETKTYRVKIWLQFVHFKSRNRQKILTVFNGIFIQSESEKGQKSGKILNTGVLLMRHLPLLYSPFILVHLSASFCLTAIDSTYPAHASSSHAIPCRSYIHS